MRLILLISSFLDDVSTLVYFHRNIKIDSIVTLISYTLFLFLGVKNFSKRTIPTNSTTHFLQIQHTLPTYSTQKLLYNLNILVAPHNLDALQLSFSSQSPAIP